MPKKLMKDAVLLGSTSIGIGVMGSVTQGLGGNTGGLQAIGSFMPALGTLSGGSAVLRQVKKLNKRR